ncbi:MAG: arsenate reductase ArsC [Flavobacteriales bacterium]|jgi:arsenate reductase (thioredoxin)|nr:arsenate reductase ArsC [Flavobacteriales bacterium]
MKKVLILCTGNSCRSQMAEGWLRHFAPDNVQVYSAGTHPEGVNPHAIHVMQTAGIDISHHTSNKIDDYMDMDFDFVITVCDNAKERCPYFPTTSTKLHESFTDPANATGTDIDQLKVYIEVRDQLEGFFKRFAEENFPSSVESGLF